MIPYKQLTLQEVFEDCQEKFLRVYNKVCKLEKVAYK